MTGLLKDVMCEDDAGRRKRFVIRCFQRPSKYHRASYAVWDSLTFDWVIDSTNLLRADAQECLASLTLADHNLWAAAKNAEEKGLYGNDG